MNERLIFRKLFNVSKLIDTNPSMITSKQTLVLYLQTSKNEKLSQLWQKKWSHAKSGIETRALEGRNITTCTIVMCSFNKELTLEKSAS